MKKIISIFLLSTALFLPGCMSGTPKAALKVVTSFYPIYILTLNITAGVQDVSVANMTPAQTGCLHDYQLTTADMRALSDADLFIINGGGMESFLSDVTAQLPDLRMIDATNGISFLRDANGAINAHVWLNPTDASVMAYNIAKHLAKADPANAAAYTQNAEVFAQSMTRLAELLKSELSNLPNKNIITFHPAFDYMIQGTGLNITASIEQEPGVEPTAQQVASLITLIKQNHITALFTEPLASSKSITSIARQTGATVYTLDPVTSGAMQADAYMTAMRKNITVLKEALNK